MAIRAASHRSVVRPRRLRAALVALALPAAACTWGGYIPGEKSWNPDVVVKPGDLAEQLALDTRHVDTLSCYAPLCTKRFRVVLTEPGTLAVSLIPELAGADAQARLVLEGIEGVLASAGTGRGPHTDVPALAVSQPVSAGMYFVLIESVGGPMPYQLTARLTPGAGPPPAPVARPRPTEEPPPKLMAISEPDASIKAGYDPAVSFPALSSFSFPAPTVDAADADRAGAPMDDPTDRMIRRQIAYELTSRGFRQAAGNEKPDMLVGFSRRAVNRDFYGLFSLYDRYGFGIDTSDWALGNRVETKGVLVIDIVDAQSERLAWHAVKVTGLGPGITPGAKLDAVLRQAVTAALLGFPPQ